MDLPSISEAARSGSRFTVLAGAFLALAALLVLLALARPLDHDESQYVAAAMLARDGLPYRDFAWLQTPLQPLLFAPLTALLGELTWPGLRIVNALLGAAAIGFCYAAARSAGVRAPLALAAAGLFAACDIFLFGVGVARNDALPAVLFAAALWTMIAATRRSTPARAVLIGLLLAGATAAKISYAVPAVAYGALALIDRRHRPLWVLVGTLPAAGLMLWLYALAPAGFLYGVLEFPARAPAEYYLAQGKAWKLALEWKAIDALKFLALGPALLALAVVAADRQREPVRLLLDAILVAALIGALLPEPTWRQYLLPVLPPLFVRLALAWEAKPPGQAMRIAAIVFAVAGLTPSTEALIGAARGGLPMAAAMRETRALDTALEVADITGPVATLAPQFLPPRRTLDPRFAPGPFHFRSRGLLNEAEEQSLHLVSRETLARHFETAPPAAIVTGGEGRWTSGDSALDAILEAWARSNGWREVPLPGSRLRLFVPPAQAARRLATNSE